MIYNVLSNFCTIFFKKQNFKKRKNKGEIKENNVSDSTSAHF